MKKRKLSQYGSYTEEYFPSSEGEILAGLPGFLADVQTLQQFHRAYSSSTNPVPCPMCTLICLGPQWLCLKNGHNVRMHSLRKAIN